jgi:cbb3-type cytochrome oxidase subunit 3
MEQNAGNTSNNPVKDRTPRQGGTWWILLLVLLIAGGIFWALGRSKGDAVDAEPVGLPATHIAVPDQIDNTVRAEGHPERAGQRMIEDEPARVRDADPIEQRDERDRPR